ncbi:MAG: Serine/threonine-protein kinase PRP4, variant 2 [Marteilia pararefringens]
MNKNKQHLIILSKIPTNSEESPKNLQDNNVLTQEPITMKEPEFGTVSPEINHENPQLRFTNPTPEKKNIAEKINDMFADDFEVNCAKTQNETEITNNDTITHLNDNYDDAGGYYKIRIGEVINDKYLIKSFIGQGVFSNVVCAQSIEGEDEGSEVAIKIIRNNDLMYNQGLKELNVLKLLNDADEFQKYNIMQLLGNFQFKNHLCIVFPKMNMNLREVLKQYGKDVGLSIMAVASYAKQLFRALKLLQKCELIHADIKPDNILVCNNNIKIKLADFGSVLKSHENDFTPYLVSRFYRAPEIIIGHPYGFPVDMWSVGVTLFELFTGHVMFPGASNNQMLLKMCEMMGKIPNRLIQRSLFRNKHFDEQGTFLYRDLDPITQNERVTPVYFTENSSSKRDLLTELKKYALHHVNAAKTYNQENNSNGENNSGGEYRSKSGGPSVVGTRAYIDKKVNQFKDLLEKILTINPQKRYDTTSALHHAFTLD